MKYWIIGDEFLDNETKKEADAQGYLKELICCKDCKKRAFGRWCGNYRTFQPEVSDDHFCADAERKDE